MNKRFGLVYHGALCRALSATSGAGNVMVEFEDGSTKIVPSCDIVTRQKVDEEIAEEIMQASLRFGQEIERKETLP